MLELKDYKIICSIGTGSFGTCFKVCDKKTNDIFALKYIDVDDSDNDNNKKEIITSEINVLRQLKHDNIVQYYEHYINYDKNNMFIVMEYCEGGDLFRLIEKCRKNKLQFEEKYIWRVLHQICRALQVCHNKINEGIIIHRDIKPANIFLDSKGNVKLGDFGLAKILKRKQIFAESMVGTPYYMSPEIVKGRKYNTKSDIWASGCLIYEICSLNPPFIARKFENLLKNITDGFFIEIPNYYSNDLQEIITFMLNIDSLRRPCVDAILHHSNLVKNTTNCIEEYPTLIPRTEIAGKKLNFSLNENFNQINLSISTPALRYELFGSRIFKTNSESSLLTKYAEPVNEVTELKSPIDPVILTQNVFNSELQNRIQKLRAQETLLREKEISLLEKEQQLNEREKKICNIENSMNQKKKVFEALFKSFENGAKDDNIKIEPILRNTANNCLTFLDGRNNFDNHKNIIKLQKKLPVSLNETFDSIEPNESFCEPTIAKVELALYKNSIKSIERKFVSFKSPRKINFKNVVPKNYVTKKENSSSNNSSALSKTREESDRCHTRKSILSIFKLKHNKDMKPFVLKNSNSKKVNRGITDKAINPIKTTHNIENIKIVEQVDQKKLAQCWTKENKRAAFELLASMNKQSENDNLNLKYRNSVKDTKLRRLSQKRKTLSLQKTSSNGI